MAAQVSKSKTTKKAAKGKPPKPACCAVLWGLAPSVEGEPATKGDAVHAVLAAMGVPACDAAYERLGDTAGAFAGLAGAHRAAAPYAGPAPEGEFVLLCGFTSDQIDDFIARSRATACTVGPKAVLTSVNAHWSLARLIEAVAAEHASIAAK